MILAYKGYNEDLTCRDFQYKRGKWFEDPNQPILCYRGFHACILPVDVFKYYSPYDLFKKVYTKVLIDQIDKKGDVWSLHHDTKICGRSIFIGCEFITPEEMIRDSIKLINSFNEIFNVDLPRKNYKTDLKKCVFKEGIMWSLSKDFEKKLIDVIAIQSINFETVLDKIQKWQSDHGMLYI